MKKISIILFCTYYILGLICLPNGNFAFHVNIPAMYKNCKATEDKDMTSFDFITDHLINFDCMFDSHDNGDEQKPHQLPQKFENSIQQQIFNFVVAFKNYPLVQTREIKFCFIEHKHPSDFNTSVFRPPIV
jgi:hypothetical protein